MLTVLVFTFSDLVSAQQDEDLIRSYIDLSTENQLLAADIKLEHKIQSPAQLFTISIFFYPNSLTCDFKAAGPFQSV